MTATPGTLEERLLKRARQIAAHALCGPEKWKPGVKAGIYEDILRGDADTEALVQGPLTALTEAANEIASLRARVEVMERALGDIAYCHETASAMRQKARQALNATPVE